MKKLLLTSLFVTGSTLASAQTAPQAALGVASSGQALLNLFVLLQTVVEFVAPYIVGLCALGGLYALFVYAVQGRKSESARRAGAAIAGKLLIVVFTTVAVWGVVGLIATVITK